MALFPTRILDLVEFCELRAPAWETGSANIGLSAEQAARFAAATVAAREAAVRHAMAIQAARVAAVESAEAMLELRGIGADAVRSIRAFAENGGESGEVAPNTVYNAALIPPPATPGRLPPPGQPREIRCTLNSDGSLTLRWKCRNPRGSGSLVYSIQRRVGTDSGRGGFVLLGTVGRRMFTDEGVPAGGGAGGGGAGRLEYIITAQRGAVVGEPSGTFIVSFGQRGATNAGGGQGTRQAA